MDGTSTELRDRQTAKLHELEVAAHRKLERMIAEKHFALPGCKTARQHEWADSYSHQFALLVSCAY